MLDLRRLRLLRELHRRGTISAVAEAFSYSPSAVSQQLATLERETGVRLLEPAGRRVWLTAQAELLVEHADRLLVGMEAAEAALAASLEDTVGTLWVAAFQTAMLSLVPRTLLRLAERHPSLRGEVVELEPEQSTLALLSGEHDPVLGEEYPGHPLPRPAGLERHDLFEDELRLVTPYEWEAPSLRRLSDRPFVVEPPGTTAYVWTMAMCRGAGFEPDARYFSTDLQVHHALVAHGLAAALVPDLALPANDEDVRLTRLPGRPHRQVFAVVRRGAGDHPTVRAFIKALLAEHPRVAVAR